MNSSRLDFSLFFSCLVIGCFFQACTYVQQKPQLINLDQNSFQDEQKLHELYQSFWFPPLLDDDQLNVGISTQKDRLEFITLQDSKFFILNNNLPFMIQSPKNTHWIVDSAQTKRPALVRYYPGVDTRTLESGTPSYEMQNALSLWKKRGYTNARWVWQNNAKIKTSAKNKKHVLSLGQYSSYSTAKNICIRVRRKYPNDYCKVIQRTDIPSIGKARIRTARGNFNTYFDGIISIDLEQEVSIKVLNADVNTAVRSSDYQNQSYKGQFYIVSNSQSSLDFVQKTTLGNYLKHVVPAEIFPNAPIEALKAQSIIARTYTLKHYEPLTGQAPYTICGDTRCQVYRGYDFEHQKSTQAIEETASMFLMYDKDFAETFYHSMCGGHTEDKKNVWGNPKTPYLTGANDRIYPKKNNLNLSIYNQTQDHLNSHKSNFFCGHTPYSPEKTWSWQKSFSSKQLMKKLNTQKKIKFLNVASRGKSGRVLHLKIMFQNGTHHDIKGELAIRRFFSGLKSSLFTVKRYWSKGQAHYQLSGRGFGHGVGMCQIGAIGRAEHGQNFKQILNAYYPGTYLRQYNTP